MNNKIYELKNIIKKELKEHIDEVFANKEECLNNKQEKCFKELQNMSFFNLKYFKIKEYKCKKLLISKERDFLMNTKLEYYNRIDNAFFGSKGLIKNENFDETIRVSEINVSAKIINLFVEILSSEKIKDILKYKQNINYKDIIIRLREYDRDLNHKNISVKNKYAPNVFNIRSNY